MQRNKRLTTLPILGKEWQISFELKPTSYKYTGFAQILHLTTGGKSSDVGDRTPALWIHPNFGVLIATTNNGKPNDQKLIKSKPKPPLNKWTSVKISKVKEGSDYTFSLVINGNNYWSVKDKTPREFSNVQVFASSNWYVAQKGFIRGLQIDNMARGKSFKKRLVYNDAKFIIICTKLT